MAGSSKSREKFPDKLSGFGYEFKDGKLRDIATGGPFKFAVRDGDQAYNQQHYEALGEVITEEVYRLLEEECQLKRVPVPHGATGDVARTFVFVSRDALTNARLMVFIHGSGVVRAGQWARRLIINDCLESGTQIPFIGRAVREGYGVLVMNTNDNTSPTPHGPRTPIKGSETPEQHAIHVWDHYIQPARATHVALVAHSYGGCVTTALFQKRESEFVRRVFAVAMTDSVHFMSQPSHFADLAKVSRNWVTSDQPLDTPLKARPGDIQRVSAGVKVHEETSWSSFQSIFQFFQQRLQEVTARDGKDGRDADDHTKEVDGAETKRPRVDE